MPSSRCSLTVTSIFLQEIATIRIMYYKVLLHWKLGRYLPWYLRSVLSDVQLPQISRMCHVTCRGDSAAGRPRLRYPQHFLKLRQCSSKVRDRIREPSFASNLYYFCLVIGEA